MVVHGTARDPKVDMGAMHLMQLILASTQEKQNWMVSVHDSMTEGYRCIGMGLVRPTTYIA